MDKIVGLLILSFVLAPAAMARAPQVVAKSAAIASGEVEAVETLDSTRVYRLKLDFGSRRPSTGNVEYEVLTAAGAVAGGGMFTVRPEMFEGETLSVLTGFGGLEFGPGASVAVWFDSTAPAAPTGGGKRAVESAAEPQIVDTCTTYCDRCADKTTMCTNGVQTYSCSCSGEGRSCTFSCFGRPQV